MASGGDARIVLDPDSWTNKYHASPIPRQTVTYASSTANDLSRDAADHLIGEVGGQDLAAFDGPRYSACLQALRARIRRAYGLADGIDIVFAPSGTDLEYIALAIAQGPDAQPVHNILLGADEVGSGCIHSAAGNYFAGETALGLATTPADPVDGFASITLDEIPVRQADGTPHDSRKISELLSAKVEPALPAGQVPLVHVVHGSKTGLILPDVEDIDRLRARWPQLSFVVDACQARITADQLRGYLDRGITVLVTGSKFMGGPPFSGFALVPSDMAAAVPSGFAGIFRRAEMPLGWTGRDTLQDSGNVGLYLRLAAAIFELERFQHLSSSDIRRVIVAFQSACDTLVTRIGAAKVESFPPRHEMEAITHPIEMQTLVTFDLNGEGKTGGPPLSFQDSARVHTAMMAHGVRLGQPVKSTRLADGRFAGTLRIGISMPQMVRFASLDEDALKTALAKDMDAIAKAYQAALSDLTIA